MLRQDKINALIPSAINVIGEVSYKGTDEKGKAKTFRILENDIVLNAYESYIAAFGANLNQSGLLPTLVFYQKTKGDGKRILWSKAIYKMLTGKDSEKDNDLIGYVIENCKKENASDPYDIKSLDMEKLDVIEDRISQIAVALKLAVRTFKIEKNEK